MCRGGIEVILGEVWNCQARGQVEGQRRTAGRRRKNPFLYILILRTRMSTLSAGPYGSSPSLDPLKLSAF